jgi:hypothetical protein
MAKILLSSVGTFIKLSSFFIFSPFFVFVLVLFLFVSLT